MSSQALPPITDQSDRQHDEIASANTLLHRQAHPAFCHDDKPSSQVFEPFKKDEGHLSVANGEKANATQAYQHHTEVLQLKSQGTWSVTVSECNSNALKAYDSPITSDPNDPAHAHVDFRGLSNSEVKTKAKRLKSHAIQRGRLHPLG